MSMLGLIPDDKKKGFQRRESTESIYSSSSAKFYQASKRKVLHPLIGSSGTLGSNSNQNLKPGGERFIAQRALSAKIHRVKQLQNQLADAHYQINELSNENRLLRTLQKRQESALQRYENSNGDLPKVLHTHNEEVRTWQSRYKQLKQQYRDVSQKLTEKDHQFQHLETEFKHLASLCKDKNLGEREKLQGQVSELSDKVQKQNETISTLQRRIALENKNFKHRLQVEMSKHKETQQDLNIAITNADKLSTIIEMKEKFIASNLPKKLQNKLLPCLNATLTSSLIVGNSKAKAITDGSKDEDLGKQIFNSDMTSQLLTRLSANSKWKFEEKPNAIQQKSQKKAAQKNAFPSSRKASYSSDNVNGVISADDTEPDFDALSKTIQHGMSNMNMKMFSTDIDFTRPDSEVEEKIKEMKKELMHKIMNDEKNPTDIYNAKEKSSTFMNFMKSHAESDSSEESGEDTGGGDADESHNEPSCKSSKNHVNFIDTVKVSDGRTNKEKKISNGDSQITKELVAWTGVEDTGVKDRKKETSLEVYCKDIMKDVERSSKLINKHVMEFANCKREDESILKQLELLDNANKSLSSGKFLEEIDSAELNNNIKIRSRSGSSDLKDVDKKNKLLAALKAIDRGEEVELNLDGLKRPKSRNRGKNKI